MRLKDTVYHFLIWCSGSDSEILEFSPNSERVKHALFGGLVLIPATVALFTMTYAVSTLTSQVYLYILIGIVWSIIILFVDRFIVSTMNPILLSKNKYIFVVAVRVMFAIFLGIIIGHPTVLLVLKKDIKMELYENRLEYYDENLKEIDSVKIKYQNTNNLRNTEYINRLQRLEFVENTYREMNSNEIAGVKKDFPGFGTSSGLRGYQESAKFNDSILLKLKTDRDSLLKNQRQDSILLAKNEISEIDSIVRVAKEFDSILVENNQSYLSQYKALNEIRDKKGGDEATLIYRVIMLFFIFLDTIPVIFKFIIPPGVYERLTAYEVVFGMIPIWFYQFKKREKLILNNIFLDYYIEQDKSMFVKQFILKKYKELKQDSSIAEIEAEINDIERLKNLYNVDDQPQTDNNYSKMIEDLTTELNLQRSNRGMINDEYGDKSVAFVFIVLASLQLIALIFGDEENQRLHSIIFLILNLIYVVFQNLISSSFNRIFEKFKSK